MTLVLHRAERADVLADALALILAEPSGDAFGADVVAVHARGVERWLSHRLATRLGASSGRADGVCANLAFPFPGRLMGDALARATGVDAASDPWRPERLAWPLLDVVDSHLGAPWLAILAAHLGGADGGGADRDRRFGAVRHLADLFDGYAVHRPAMVLAWSNDEDHDGERKALPDDMAWQAELWRHLRAAVGTPSPAERLLDGCARLIADPTLVDLPPRVSLFGLTRLPASYLDVLRALAVHRDMHVLALHPSPTAWAAIAADASLDAEAATSLIRHPLLRAWGRDSREMQLVLAGRTRGDDDVVERHHPLPAAPTAPASPTSLLARLQDAIRADEPPSNAADRPRLDPSDRSLQIHACHGRARQAEVVRDAITHLFAADATLEPRHVVVLCPDIDDFAPLLRAAFDGVGTEVTSPDGGAEAEATETTGPPVIPYRLADRSLRQTNPVLGAVADLLALVDARLSASQVLAFAAIPPVRERFRFDDDDLERIVGWVRQTGIRWGLDADHRAPYGLAGVDAGTWDAGVLRLLLGVAMSEDGLRLVGGVLPLDDVDAGDIDLAGRFAELVGRLGEVIRDLDGARPIQAWVEAIDRAADLLLVTRPADAWQRSQLDRLLSDVLTEAGAGPDLSAATGTQRSGLRADLRVAEIRDLLRDRLRGQPTRAAFRTGDLTMCTLVPMRSVPHRVVCLVGLDDGAFPRGGAPDGDDLLVSARHPGDHDRGAEDRQLLLDAVLSARDTLVITYAGRDVRSNEVLPPAVPINELLDVVDATVRTDDGSPARQCIVHQHPLHPFDLRCFEPGALGAVGAWALDPGLVRAARAAAGPRRPVGPFLLRPLAPIDEPVVALEDLVAFVQHPVRAFLRQRLALSLRNDEDRPADSLAVELDGLAAWGVGERLVDALLGGADADAVCAAEVARGLLPPGALGLKTLSGARATAEAIVVAALSAASGIRGSLEVDVDLGNGRRLVGGVPDVIGDTIRAATFSRLGPKPRLAAWVRFLAATATHPERSLISSTVGRNGQGAATATLPVLATTPEERATRAVELLNVVVDLRDRGLCEPLPLYAATSHSYVTAQRSDRDDPVDAAAKYWTSEFDWNKEDKEPEHVLVLGGVRTFAQVWDPPPPEAEDGPGWATAEKSRFGRLARRLWDPVLDAAQPRRGS